MALVPTNYLTIQSSNYNYNNSIFSDGVNPTEKLNYLFKKSFGIANTKSYYDYSLDSTNFKSSIFLTINSTYSQYIPTTQQELEPLIVVDGWTNPSWPGTLNSGIKKISSNYPYIAKYENVLLTDSVGYSNSFSGDKGLAEQGHPVFTNQAIPYYYGDGSTFNHIVFNSNTNTQLSFGSVVDGSWLLDTDSGVLTFYDAVQTAVVNVNNPPRLTFWRYEGLIGNSGIVNVGSY